MCCSRKFPVWWEWNVIRFTTDYLHFVVHCVLQFSILQDDRTTIIKLIFHFTRCLPLNCQVYKLRLVLSGVENPWKSPTVWWIDSSKTYQLLLLKKSNGWEHVKNITIITTAEKMHLLRCFCNMARSVLENCFVAKEVVMTPLPLKLPGYLRGRSLSTIGPSYFIKEWI